MRKKELPYFQIGKAYGGSQRWMLDPWMHIGGCGALTTCDALVYFALHRGRPECCPYPAEGLTKRQYVRFAMSMKLYLQPRSTGIKDLETYMEGVRAYLEDMELSDISLTGFSGDEPAEAGEALIRDQIDRGIPVPYLMLKHQDAAFKFFEWHWFLVNGYEAREDGFYIKAATYGKAHWLPFAKLWDTGQDEKGGMAVFSLG